MGTWIEIRNTIPFTHPAQCRSLRGNVDRNLHGVLSFSGIFVVPYVGTWIEMVPTFRRKMLLMRRSLRGNVDRNADKINKLNAKYQSFPTWERG